MNEIIIDSNGGDGNWENDFSEQNLIGIKEPDTECEILAKISAYEYAFYSYGLLPLLLLWTSISNWSVITSVSA